MATLSCADHTLGQPVGYQPWHDWAARMSKTHEQIQCPQCKRWCIWVPKAPADRLSDSDVNNGE